MSSKATALITGAGARIGAAIARALHERGCRVLVHYNANADGANALAGELNETRAESAAVVSGDLSRTDGVEALSSQIKGLVEKWGGGLDVLVHNASRFYPTPIADTRLYQWEDLFNSNLRGPYFLTQALLEPLRVAGGAIVNILDIHSERPMRGHAVYSASKAALRMLTQALAVELAPQVRVNGVSPGAILWPERDVAEDARAEILSRIAMERLGDPSDVASAVVYLALDAPYITGEIIKVDGGRSLNM